MNNEEMYKTFAITMFSEINLEIKELLKTEFEDFEEFDYPYANYTN